jgi:hypothetical protein
MSKISLIDSNLDIVAFAWTPGPVSAEFPKMQEQNTLLNHIA